MIAAPPRKEAGPIEAEDAARAGRALRERYREAGVRPQKRLGQHFLADLNLARKIADLAMAGPATPDPAPAQAPTQVPAPPGAVFEIGAGLGALTFFFAARGERVTAVEIDPRLADWLRESLAPWPGVRVIPGDIRTIRLGDVAAEVAEVDAGAAPLRVAGNLPYYLTSEILLQLMRERSAIASAVVMVQDEVAERLTAQPGTKAYGSLTVTLGLAFDIELLLRVPHQAFWPAPDVDSAVIRLTPRPWNTDMDPALIERVVRAAFGQRRKTLGNVLPTGLGIGRDIVAAALEAVHVDPRRRAETLSAGDFIALATALAPALAPEQHRIANRKGHVPE
jgi:16S rRNA (adenine1518-N6/adenine1519-N6)-dimethyltransferase